MDILGSGIGTYRTPGGKTYPAIWVSPPKVDPSWICTGLEITIQTVPEVRKVTSLTSEKLRSRYWILELRNFDINKSMADQIEAIQVFYPITTTVYRSQTSTDFEEARVGIYDPVITRAFSTVPFTALSTIISGAISNHNLNPLAHPNGIASDGEGIEWTPVASNQVMEANKKYLVSGLSPVLLALPPTSLSNNGDTLKVSLDYAGTAFRITQESGQSIIIGANRTTEGLTGSLGSTQDGDYIDLVYVGSGIWNAVDIIGNLEMF
jgi:hypothetical protein